jgi:hypothetical protein
MKIKMKVQMSGTRNGAEWPDVGETVDLPKEEAAKMCAAGMAIPVASKDEDVEVREETPVEVTPEDPKVNKRDADKSAKAAEKRAALVETKAAPKSATKG